MSFKQYNYKEPIKSEGCCFCCDCYLAGLDGSDIEDAFDYAVQKGWVRGTDSYVLNHSKLNQWPYAKIWNNRKKWNKSEYRESLCS